MDGEAGTSDAAMDTVGVASPTTNAGRPAADCSDMHDATGAAGGTGDTFKSSSGLFSSIALIPEDKVGFIGVGAVSTVVAAGGSSGSDSFVSNTVMRASSSLRHLFMCWEMSEGGITAMVISTCGCGACVSILTDDGEASCNFVDVESIEGSAGWRGGRDNFVSSRASSQSWESSRSLMVVI
jgi:hypothetical protein